MSSPASGPGGAGAAADLSSIAGATPFRFRPAPRQFPVRLLVRSGYQLAPGAPAGGG
jgi:hypothetical protein